jgi:hypothetical protein
MYDAAIYSFVLLFTELVYCGNILDDDSTLKSCGLKPGVMVHVLKKKEKGLYFHVCIYIISCILLLIEMALCHHRRMYNV